MIEILLVGCGVVLGFYLGWNLREAYAKRIVLNFHKQMEESIQQRVVEIEITKEGNQYFVYNIKTKEFLTQGSSHEEITEKLNARFPGTFFMADPENLKRVNYRNDSV